MEILNIISDNLTVFIILVIILIINFCCILYLVLKERKEDKEEINEILNDMNPVEKQQDQKLEENKREVEEMLLKMQQDLEAKPEDAVTNFENEQEEKSIISYQELLESVKNSKEQTNVIPVKIEDEKIEIEEEPIIRIEEKVNEPTIKMEEENINQSEQLKKFKSKNFFISPIFGKQENNIKYPTVPKNNTTKIEEFINENNNEDNLSITKRLDEEITKNESFLNALKEFRKNLD